VLENNLPDLTGKEILEKLNSGEISVLEMLGAHDLRVEMLSAGKYCGTLAKAICRTNDDSKLRQRAVSAIKPLSPTKLYSSFPQFDGSIVIGFNHPSLGEIFRLLYLGVCVYREKPFLFPVNLPWYEAIVPIIPELTRLGVTITPMITPSTEKKLNEIFDGDEGKLMEIHRIKVLFERQYMRTAKKIAGEKGVIVVAPSATRQAKVIGDNIHPAMTLLAHMILKDKDADVMFLPVAIIEPKHNDRRFNPMKVYGIHPCTPFYTDELRRLSANDRDLDYVFLKRIEDVYLKHKSY